MSGALPDEENGGSPGEYKGALGNDLRDCRELSFFTCTQKSCGPLRALMLEVSSLEPG